jgi:hypothetical protein
VPQLPYNGDQPTGGQPVTYRLNSCMKVWTVLIVVLDNNMLRKVRPKCWHVISEVFAPLDRGYYILKVLGIGSGVNGLIHEGVVRAACFTNVVVIVWHIFITR